MEEQGKERLKDRVKYEKLRKLGLHFCIKYNNIVQTTEFCRECPYNNLNKNITLGENSNPTEPYLKFLQLYKSDQKI